MSHLPISPGLARIWERLISFRQRDSARNSEQSFILLAILRDRLVRYGSAQHEVYANAFNEFRTHRVKPAIHSSFYGSNINGAMAEQLIEQIKLSV